jgi:drug/metabolite transporter (DMT)-like permease
LFVTVSRGRFAAVSSEQAMGWVMLVTAVVTVVLAAVLGEQLDVPLHDGRALGLAVLAGVLGAGLPSILFLVGIRAIGGTRAGILMLIEPLVGVTLAAVLLGEALAPIQVLGGVAILTAALLLQRGPTPVRPSRSGAEAEQHAVPVAEHP